MLDQLSTSARFCIQVPVISTLAKVRGIPLKGDTLLFIDHDINYIKKFTILST